MEEVTQCVSHEEARNKALAWMEDWGGPIGPYYEIEIGRLGAGAGMEVGVSATIDPYRRIRLDFDPWKGPHYNVEVGKGSKRMKHAFCFPGDQSTIDQLMKSRAPRNG